MTEAPMNPDKPSQNSQVESLREHNQDIANYQPSHERMLGTHSGFIIEKGDLKRPGLQVVEFGAGPYDAFRRRANTVALRGGHYTAIDLDPQIVSDAQSKVSEKVEEQKGKIVIRQGNSNEALPHLNVATESQDVAIINSVAANATPAECHVMLQELQELRQQRPDDAFLAGTIPFLERFIKNLPKNLPKDFPIEGVKGNVLVLLNALLALKPGGRLVYAHNEQNMMLAGIQQVEGLCEAMGIPHDNTHIYDPWYNALNMKDILLVRPSKYDMAILTADKQLIDTSEASL